MERILVTGGNGWIGRYALNILTTMNMEVHAVYRGRLIPDIPCYWHQADLLCLDEVERLMKKVKPSHLLHLAWETIPPQCYQSINNYFWAQSSLSLVHHFFESGGQRVVVAGTCAEYEWSHGYLKEDVTPCSYQTSYAASKNGLRLLLRSYSEQVGLSLCWGRIFHLYGPYDPGTRLVSSVISSLLTGEEAKCTHGNQYRDYLYVEDVAHALVSLLKSNVQGIVNVASGNPIQVKEIATTIAKMLGKEKHLKLGAIPSPDNEPMFVGANVERLTHEVGWNPRYTLDLGLKETILWWKNYLNIY